MSEKDKPANELIGETAQSQADVFDAKEFLRNLTTRPGVYRMKNAAGDIIYVGKASNLRNRLSSYFQKNVDSRKTRNLVSHIADVETTVTRSETEALILENQLIKAHMPRYNILLRDDKSYPYVFMSTEQEYPRLSYHRGARKQKGAYFGPYPNGYAVRKTLNFVQKLFLVRQCEDSYFRNRSRPCLQYQIKRCSGPCVGIISTDDYGHDVEMTRRVLAGENKQVMEDLIAQMQQAAEDQAYERAATLRDRISDLKHLTDQQFVAGTGGQADIVACAVSGGQSCVQVFYVRNGLNLGNTAFYPSMPADMPPEEVLYSFVTQYYFSQELPQRIILSHAIEDQALLAQAFSERAGRKVVLNHNVRGERARWLEMAASNADISLKQRLASRAGQARRLDELRQLLEMEDPPGRIECFDISHTQGELTVASCVVFNAEGPLKSDYRRFDIKDITPGDDYAAMRQALQRRYTRTLKEGKALPDLLLVDGGAGQVGVAREVLAELQLTDTVRLVGVAKGPERRPGEETLILTGAHPSERHLGSDSLALHLIQHVRDEAHRFAIAGHRAKRGKARRRSALEDVPGLGPKRRQALLTHFGGIQQLKKASAAEIARVPGISVALGQSVYDRFHEQ